MFLRLATITLFTIAPFAWAALRAAAVKVDITPTGSKWLMGYGPRQSTAVHDRIYHRIAILHDGQTEFVLVSTDVCVFSPTVYDEAAQRLRNETGIAPVNFWWTVTHTHSAPEVGPPGLYAVLLKGRSDHPVDHDYTAEIISKMIGGVKEARSRLEPARLSMGIGRSLANINRRARDMDGRISLGLNPDGPVDRQIGLIRADRTDGAPVVLIANYAMHGTVLNGRWTEISGDAQGIVADYVEKKIGAPMLYVNGAAGNLAPIYSVYDNPRAGHLTQFNVMLGDRILAANQELGPGTGEVTIRTSEKWIETPRKKGMTWTTDLAAFSRDSPAGVPVVRLPLRFVTVNDTAIWGGPVEMFCELALAVRDASPFARTFFFGYTNGWLGYLPTKRAFAEGGYEPATSPFSDQAEKDTVDLVTAYFQGLAR
jgi:hypothetical protein